MEKADGACTHKWRSLGREMFLFFFLSYLIFPLYSKLASLVRFYKQWSVIKYVALLI